MPARGRYRVNKKNSRSRGFTRRTHNSNEAIHPTTFSSTAERSTAVTPTKRSTHTPRITTVQQRGYSSCRGVPFQFSTPSSTDIGETTVIQQQTQTIDCYFIVHLVESVTMNLGGQVWWDWFSLAFRVDGEIHLK